MSDPGRKFILAAVGVVLLAIGLFTKFITDGNFIAGLGIVFGLYAGANVAQKIGGGE